MTRSTALRYLRRAFFIVGILCVLVGVNHRTPAQDIGEETCFDLGGLCDVEAVAAIADSTDEFEIDAYATEEIVSFDLLEFGDEAVIDAGLFEDDALIDEVEGDDDGTGFAEADLIDPVALGSLYTMEGDFYIFDQEEGFVFLGSLFAQVVAAAPEIDETSEPGDHSGVSGQLTINGFALFDQFDGTVSISRIPGLHWGSTFQGSPDGTQITLSYTIDSNAKSGDQELSLGTRFGLSNSVIFTIFDPPPLVTSVQPDPWHAGTQTPITVGGQHFGPCAKISVTGPGVTGFSTDSGPSTDIQVKGTVTIDINSPGGQATVTVTSDGEACNGFLGRPGETPSANDKATIEPAAASPIVIVKTNDPQQCQGTDLSQETQTIYAGQQVKLRACLNSLQPGETVASATWTVNGNVVALFGISDIFINSETVLKTFTPPGDCVDQVNNGSKGPVGSCTVDPFFWVCPIKNAVVCIYPDTVSAVFEYTLTNGGKASNAVSYQVQGPGNTSVPITVNPDGGTGTVQIMPDPPGVSLRATGITVISSDISNGTLVGMELLASAQLPQDPNTGQTVGSFSWARLFKKPSTRSFIQGSDPASQIDATLGPGAFTCSFVDPLDPNPEVVTYPSSAAQQKVPKDLLLVRNGTGLPPLQGEGGFSYLETDYLFWEPDAAGSESTILIPLGAVTYQTSGAATNSLDPTQGTQGWLMNAGCGTGPTVLSLDPGVQFPVWTKKQKLQSCSPQR